MDPEQVADETLIDTPAVEETPVSETAVEASGGGDGAVETSSIDDGLADLARSYGIDPELFPSGDALERAITHFDRLYTNQIKQGWEMPQSQRSDPPQQRQDAKPTEGAKVGLAALSKEHFDEGLVQWSEQVLAHFNSLQEKLNTYEQKFGELDPVKETVNQFQQRMQADAHQKHLEAFDGFLDKLGPEWADLFGKGHRDAINPRSPHFANRGNLEREYFAIQVADQAMGRKANPDQQMKRALQAAFGDQLPTIERRKLALQAHQRKNGALARPTAKKGGGTDPEAVVLSGIKEWASKVG